MMAEKYKHKGRVLNIPIIRDLLNKSILYGLYRQGEWWSVREFKDRIEQYHCRNGGLPFQLKDFPTNLRDILWEMKAHGKAERNQKTRPHCWRLVIP